ADERSDIFALGAVLYEMLSGRRAFKRDSQVETLNAILKEEPPDIGGPGPPIPPAVERIVRRCLEKDPAERFRSAHDVAVALEALSGLSWTGDAAQPPTTGRWWRWTALAAFVALAALAPVVTRRLASPTSQVRLAYQRLTFRRGIVQDARFTHDGQGIVYSA